MGLVDVVREETLWTRTKPAIATEQVKYRDKSQVGRLFWDHFDQNKQSFFGSYVHLLPQVL